MLKNVTITKNDTCLTYCLKRIGLDFDFCNFEMITEKFEKIPFEADMILEPGDLLLWDQELEYNWMPNEIIENRIIWNLVPVKFHFGVIEADNLFSDCTRLEHNPHPTLRIRKLNKVETKPAFVLMLKKF